MSSCLKEQKILYVITGKSKIELQIKEEGVVIEPGDIVYCLFCH